MTSHHHSFSYEFKTETVCRVRDEKLQYGDRERTQQMTTRQRGRGEVPAGLAGRTHSTVSKR